MVLPPLLVPLVVLLVLLVLPLLLVPPLLSLDVHALMPRLPL